MSQLTPNGRLFILGAPRSGTTFLASLLKETKYGAPVETHFITKYFKKAQSYGDLSKKNNFVRLAKDILNERPVRQWRLRISAEELYEVLKPHPSLQSLTDQLLLMARKKKGEEHDAWGDKTPHYLADWSILSELFPDSKFIFIYRDGRDVALSLFQKPWGPSTTIGCALYWAALNREKTNLERSFGTDTILFLSYEELLLDPNKHVKKIYKFLNEPLDSNNINELTSSTKSQNFNKWRQKMTPRQKRQFEAVAGNQLASLGYPLIYDQAKLYPGEMILSKFLEALNRLDFLFKANVIDGFKIRFLNKEPFAE